MTYEVYSSERMPRVSIISLGCARDIDSTRSCPLRRNVFVVHYCISGHGYFLDNRVDAGQGFVFLPGQIVEYHPSKSDPWTYYWIIIDTDDPQYFLNIFNPDPSTGIFSYNFVDIVEEQFRILERSRNFYVSPVNSLAVFFDFLRRHATNETGATRARDYAKAAKNYIDTNYHLHPSICELAKQLNISQSYLYRVFFEEYGVSPKEYLNRFCLEQAKSLLRHSDLNVSQIAASVGYNDVLAFSSFFSKKQGKSPTAYRKEKLQKSEKNM